MWVFCFYFLYFWAIKPNNMMFPGSSKINQPSTRFDEEEKQKDEYLRPLYELRRRANESDGPITNFHQLIRSSENNQPSLSITRSDEENERNDGFDIEGIRGSGLMPFSCQGLSTFTYPYRPLVKRYAKLGLHRYNIKEGTNFELDALIKFNMRSVGACSFLITLAARDTVAGRPMQIFQVRVDENRFGRLDATCTTARIKGETTDGFCLPQPVYGFPGWPSDDVVFDASERFCSVEISKLRSNPWIRLYLELAVYTKDRRISDEDLSKLEIVKVVIETTYDEPPLKAKSSDLYIVFKGLARNGLGEQLERKAIIKSVFDEQTGSLSLMGDLCKSQDDVTFMSVEEMHYRFRQSLGAV
ncbi:hypothetical protein BRARA_J02430 [Brassica rapa]|uniref:Uncharacterized protein n=1 Tax=Brassica campestris TaxID=3711 RepID=A0A397XWG2_BRACM|nr:hypothetical protein BRARA_J02430 [Brassica rapa]